jgi:DNA-binding GntR family transcriptional regulator
MGESVSSATHYPHGGAEAVDGEHVSDRIFRGNLSQQIAERLRDDIVHGRIPPGTHLVQDELCERFGTSRMPVRDALQQLTHVGILEQNGQQRAVVSLGIEDLVEVHALTAVLHGWAARRAATLASTREIAELAAMCQPASHDEDPYAWGLQAMQFHRKINLLARSPRLIRTLIAFQQTVPRTIPFVVRAEMAPSHDGHQAIVAAIQARNAELAEQLTRSHSMKAVDLLQRSLASGPDT